MHGNYVTVMSCHLYNVSGVTTKFVKGVLYTLKAIFFNIFFLIKILNMCTYTVKCKNKKIFIKVLGGRGRGVRDSTERPKIGVCGVKDTAKNNKD